MPTCRSCHAEIKWIELTSGKKCPVDPVRRHIDDVDRDTKLVTESGDIITKKFNGEFEDGYGFPSHFSTCPNADEWRKK